MHDGFDNPRDVAFVVEPENAVTDVFDRLQVEFTTRRRAPSTEEVLFLDTFDWRVHRSGASLRIAENGNGKALSLIRNEGPRALTARIDRRPDFHGDLPAGPLRDELGPLTAPRRLLPMASVRRSARSLEIFDEEEKTVCRVVAVANSVRGDEGWDAAPVVLRVEGVRGYEAERRAVERFLRFQLGLRQHRSREEEDILSLLGESAGRDPSKLRVTLSRRMTAGEATREVLAVLLDVILVNRRGVLEETDTEFLHDFRVAVRRTRSVLAQLKKVFPSTASEHYGAEFRWLGSVTGRARDLDVLLLALPGYVSRLAVSDRASLAPLKPLIERERRAEQKKLARAIASKRFENLVRNWSRLLGEPPPNGGTPLANAPVLETASGRIRRRLRRIRRLGRSIDRATETAELHRVRIQCKKLRYLLEVFRSLYDPGEIDVQVKALKRLQDALGDFNDAQVHAELLHRLATGRRKGLGNESLLAVGQLLAHLHRRGAKDIAKFFEEFAAFDGPANRKLAKRLFSGSA